MDLKRIELIDNIKESKEDGLEYHNPKMHSSNYNRFVDEIKKSKLKLNDINPKILSIVLENLALNKLSHNFLDIKEKLFVKCINYPNTIDIAKQEDVLEYDKEKTERVTLSSENEYLYSQMHIRKSIFRKISLSKLNKIYNGNTLDKSKGASIPIHLNEDEIKEYKTKNKDEEYFNKLSNYGLNRRKE